jgi:hypothetical protein
MNDVSNPEEKKHDHRLKWAIHLACIVALRQENCPKCGHVLDVSLIADLSCISCGSEYYLIEDKLQTMEF